MRMRYLLIAGAAALALGLAGCGSSDDDDTADAPVTMPEPMPDPDPVPTDLEVTQTEAAAAAAAAMTASDNAAASASSAADATATLATLQTGADSNAAEMGGNEAAYAAHAAASAAADAAAEAAAASAAAAAATTGTAGEAALRMALDAQDAAEAAEATAMAMSEAAIAAAMTELHIDGTIKTVGESSVDADADASSSPPVAATATVYTGFQDYVRRATPTVPGKEFVHTTVRADDQEYVQAVAGRVLNIGKTLDTTDDAARLTVIHSRVSSKKVSVYAVDDTDPTDDFVIRTYSAGGKSEGDTGAEITTAENAFADSRDLDDAPDPARALKSLGMYHEATERTTVPEDEGTEGTPVANSLEPMT